MEQDSILLELSEQDEILLHWSKTMPGREYLVTHGRAGHIGRFAAAGELSRGDAVVVKTRRGLELGEVLGEVFPERGIIPDDFVGELLRLADDADQRTAIAHDAWARQLAADAEPILNELGLTVAVLDAEVLLDGKHAALHAIPLVHGDLGPLLERLGESHSLIVRLYDLGAEPPPPADAADHLEEFKCDKPDCGEGDCTDCGTDGGCNSCSAGGAKELSEYFAGLRAEMEQKHRVPLV